MWNLETEIAQWKRRLTRAGLAHAETVDELEEHLRSDVARQVDAGVGEESAFRAAVQRFGDANALAREFEKIPVSYIPSRSYPAGSLRLAFLTLALGLVLGIAGHESAGFWLGLVKSAVPSGRTAAMAKVILPSSPARPMVFPSPEKVLARLRKNFDEAVVVVLAEQTYDHDRKVIWTSALEVWKGPANLAGKALNLPLESPMSRIPSQAKERVLMFLPMTPSLATYYVVFFSGDALRMNPTITVGALKHALTAGTLARATATPAVRKSWLALSREFPDALAKAGLGESAAAIAFEDRAQPIDEPPLSLSAQATRMEDLSVSPYFNFAATPRGDPQSLNMVAQSLVAERLAGVLDGDRRVLPSLHQIRRARSAGAGE